MQANQQIIATLFYLAGAISLTIGLLSLRKKKRRQNLPLAIATFLTALWSFLYTLEIATYDLTAKFCFTKIEYLAIATIPTLWLIFIIQYSGHTFRFDKKILALLFLEPTITILLSWTNERHGLIYSQTFLSSLGDYLLLEAIYGFWFWIHVAYSYLLATIGAALLWDKYRHTGDEGKKQAMFLLAATFLPWMGSFIIAEFWLGPHIDLSPILLTAGYVIAAVGLWKMGESDVVPIARKVAIEGMTDAYLVLDNGLTILDMNKAAERAFGRPKAELIGRFFPDMARLDIPFEEIVTTKVPFRRIVALSDIYYEVHAEPIFQNNGHRLGILATWRDATEHIVQKQLLEERVSQLNSVNYIIGTINSAATLSEVYDAALRSIGETLHGDKSSISLFDPTGVIRFVAWHGLSETYREGVEGHSPWKPYSVNPGPIFIEDVAQQEDAVLFWLKRIILDEGIQALGLAPIVHRGHVLGQLAVYYTVPHHFTEREIELMGIIAGHLAIAIEKVRLLEQAQNRLRRIEALQKIDTAISATLDLQHQIDTLLTHVVDELHCDMSVLFLVDRSKGLIVPVAEKGSYHPQVQRFVSFHIGEGGAGWIVLHKQNLYIPDVRQDARWQETESSIVDQIVSYLGAPLIVNGEVIGVLDISTRTPREFTKEEVEFLQTLAGQAAVAIKNAQLYQDLQNKVSQLQVLNNISRELMTEHDIDALLQKIVTEATELLNASHGLIFLYNEDKNMLVVSADSANLKRPLSMGEGLAGRVAKTRRSIILENYSQWEHRSPRYADVPIAAAMGTPMMHGGELIGVLVVYEMEGNDRIFTEEDIGPLSLLASQAASAVSNAQLIERLHQRINRLQTLHQISAELSKLKGVQDSCHSVAWLIHEKLGYDYVYVILVDPKTQERRVVDCLGKDCQRVGEHIPTGHGLIEKTIQDRTLHYWPDISNERDYHPGGANAQCEVDVPIQSRERLFGVLVVEDDQVDAFDQEDFDTLQTVANQLAIALENAQRMEELSALLQATTKLYQAGQAVGKAKTVTETITTSARSLRNASNTEAVFIHIANTVHPITYGIDKYDNEVLDEKGEIADEIAGLLDGVRSVAMFEQDDLPAALRLPHVNRALTFPLKRGALILGGILILLGEEVQISPQQMDLLAIYANQTTIAIEKAISMEQEKRKALEQEVVSSIVRSLNETLDVEMVFPQLAAGVGKLVAADRISVALPDEERKGFVLSVILDAGDNILDGQWSPRDATSAVADVEGGRVHVTPDLAAETMYPVEAQLYQTGYRSRINMPLKVGDEVLGALNIVSRQLDEFTPEKLPPLLQIADALAISIANSLSIKQERKRAQEISLLYALSRSLSSLNTVEDVISATAQSLVDAVAEIHHVKIILASAQFRNYVIPRNIVGPHHAWVNNINAYPTVSRALNQESDCFKIARDELAMNAAEREIIFTKSGQYAWLLPLVQEHETMGVLIVERDKQSCADAEIRVVKSIAELLMMTLRRVFLFHEVEGAYLNAVLALALASDAKDSYTADHSQRLENIAVAVAEKMGLGEQQIEDLRFGARLHDIGKIGVPDAILKKPGPLTEEEWEIMHKHPEIGENILAPLPRLQGAAKIVRHHHERYDGRGYPDHLAGENIPIGARILSVVDAYGAITDRRVYKSERPHQEALEELKRNAGTQFDPRVVDVFLALYKDSPPATSSGNHDLE